jgi:hypothetical protein
MRRRSAAALAGVGSAVGAEEILLVLGLALLTVGLWPVVGVSALVVPGVVLIWLVLPSRAAFIARPPVLPEQPRRKR